jgi:molybdopterin-containing oxidoreductase family membrane subunit
MSATLKHETELERIVLSPLRKTSMPFYFIAAGLGLVFALGFLALVNQWRLGLGVTGLGRPVYWGVYITNFVFFIGISHAGTLISAILRVTQAEWRRPITRIAEAITFFALILGLLQIWIDMGRPERIIYPFIWGRFQSPFLWDFTCVGIYLMSSMLYLYLPMIPDLARMRDRMNDAPAWRQKLYRFMAFGWHGSHEQHRRLEVGIGIMAIVIIPVAVSVHTVVSWIFGMTMQPMWHSTILGPYFVVGAIFSGIAMLFVFMTLLRKAWHFEKYIGAKQYNYLGILLLVMSAFWGYFTLAEFLTTGYATLTHETAVLNAKLTGEYAPAFWIMVIGNLVIPFSILIWKKGRTPVGTFIASLSILVGMWVERFLIVAPSLTRPSLGLLPATYSPSLSEAAIMAGSLALFALLFLLFFKVFPAISVWEVEEGQVVETVKRKASELMEQEGAQPAA